MRNVIQLLALWAILILSQSCNETNRLRNNRGTFDKQAHRGGRGLMPENTIASEMNAINYDCTLEMDLQMSKDKRIVVSHDSYFNSDFCLAPGGEILSKNDGLSRLIYHMTYDSIKKYDAGLKPYPAFPFQIKIPAVKPLLSVLIDSVELYAAQKHHINHYNIEIKSNLKSDGVTYSSLQEYIDSAMKIIIGKGIAPRTMMQSFDKRALTIIHDRYPAVKTAFLVGATNKKTMAAFLHELGFKPNIFSPEFSLVTSGLVKAFHKQGILVIPWTPDTPEDIARLISMGVDGVITDYPNLFKGSKIKSAVYHRW